MGSVTVISGELDKALMARGLDPVVCAGLGMRAEPARNGGGEALAFDFRRNGAVVNTKFRTSVVMGGDKGRMWQTKGGAYCFFNEDALREPDLIGKPLIITEGEFDTAAAVQAGFFRTVSVPCGAPEKPVEDGTTKYRFIDEARDLLKMESVPEIILAVDSDGPGSVLLQELSVRLGRFRCKYLTYPKHPTDHTRRCKDLNEVLLHYGANGVVKTIERAQWLKVDGVFRMSELPPLPNYPTYEIGMGALDEHYKVRLGDLSIWTGIPSHGKSSVVNDLCCRLVARYGMNVCFGSFEQTPQSDHKRNLRTWFCRRPVGACTSADLRAADEWIDKHFSFIVPNEDDDVTLEWALDRMEAAVVQHGCKVVVIDPWNEMDHSRNRDESLTEYTGRAIKALRRFAKKMAVHLIIVAHPTKQKKDDNGVFQVPTLYDISDSAHWYNKADLGVVVHRFPDYSIIRVAKSRYHDLIGVPGEVRASYVFEERRFDVWPKPGDNPQHYGDDE